jgi:hypothetical protein
VDVYSDGHKTQAHVGSGLDIGDRAALQDDLISLLQVSRISYCNGD